MFFDSFDPRGWREEYPWDTLKLSLSDRVDVYVLLDRQDHEWAIRQGRWCHTYGSGDIDPETGVIARPDHMYARRCPWGGSAQWLHKEVLLRALGPPPPLHTIGDHINGLTLDCRRANLRWATPSMNATNRRRRRERRAA